MRRISLHKCNVIICSATTFSSRSISVKGNAGVSINFENEVKCLDDATTLFHQMKILSIMMSSYCLMHRVDCAFSVLPIYLKNGIPFNVRKRNSAMQLFCEISQKGLKPNVFVYTTILKGLFEVGRIGDAKKKKFFAEMLSAGPIPDLHIHCTLLNGYFKYGLVEEAMSLFNKLEKKREDIGIALCKNGELDKAHSIFKKLSFIGLLLDVRTYIVMINGFCLEGLLDEAKDVLRKMEDNSCFPNNVTYNVIVQGFLRWNKISEMASFMEEMAGRGFSFDATTTELLINIVRENPELHSEKKQ